MLRKEAREVHKYLPSTETFFCDFPSLNMDTVPKRDINHAIEEVVQKIKPSIVFTHFSNDINSDHRLVSEATAVACRPYAAPFVKQIYCYEVMSAAEWSTNANSSAFIPICYNDIAKYLDKKLKALSMYKSQEKHYPHTRSVKSVECHASYRGNTVGMEAAECFYPLRIRGIDI